MGVLVVICPFAVQGWGEIMKKFTANLHESIQLFEIESI